jgi:hypothetical protein
MALIIDRLPNTADDLAVALTEGGTGGLRTALAKLSRDLRADLAQALAAIAEDAPAHDDSDENHQGIAAQ